MKPNYFKYPERNENFSYKRKQIKKTAIILYNYNDNKEQVDKIYNEYKSGKFDIFIVELKDNIKTDNWSVIIKNKVDIIEGILIGILYASHLSHSLKYYYDGFLIIDQTKEIKFDDKQFKDCKDGIEFTNCFYFNAEWLWNIRFFNPLLRKDNFLDELRIYCDSRNFTNKILNPKEKFGLFKKNNRVAMVLVNYNMHERCDQIYESILKYVKYPVDFYIVDNGSDIVEPSKYTTIWLRKNIQTTNGWNMGIAYANSIRNTFHFDYIGFWIWITTSSYDIESGDILSPMIEYLNNNNKTMAISPSVKNGDSWNHLKKNGDIPKEVIFVDNLATLYRTEWFDSIRYFDPNEIRGFGVDIENGILTRYCGYNCVVDHRVSIYKPSGIGYKMKRMNANSNKRCQLALAEMQSILRDRYGDYPSLYTKKIHISNGIFTNRSGTWFYDNNY